MDIRVYRILALAYNDRKEMPYSAASDMPIGLESIQRGRNYDRSILKRKRSQ